MMADKKWAGLRFLIYIGILFTITLAIGIYYGFERSSIDTHSGSDGSPSDMVILTEFIPGIVVDLVYTGSHNVYGQRIYDIDCAYLRKATAEKLRQVQLDLMIQGYGLKIWDAYRPPSAQFKLWEVMPDPRYVVNPHEGYSYHSLGVAVDLTIIDGNGRELEMPSQFDEFSPLANRDFSDVSLLQAENARFLEEVMQRHGFHSIFNEWWHFTDSERDRFGLVQDWQLPLPPANSGSLRKIFLKGD